MRSKEEQINYIMKHRNSAMNSTDFENALWDLFHIGEEQGRAEEREAECFRRIFDD